MPLSQPEKLKDEVPTLVAGHDTPGGAALVPSSPVAAEAATLVPPAASEAEAATLVPPSHPTCQLESKSTEGTYVDLAAGILGPYREVRPLRAWKSGTIYSAVHPRLRRQVELQVLDEVGKGQENSPNLASRDAFLQTARKAASIRHPNVETGLLEAATYGNATFVAREHSEFAQVGGFGPRDRSQRRREPLYPNETLVRALLDAARGLAEIHRAGLHHGHITLAVLRRGSQGQICISGLAVEPVVSGVEGSGPHPFQADPVQKDIFDLGCSFAELVCGLVPQLEGPRGAIAKRLCDMNPGLSRALAGVLERCLKVDDHRRFRNVRELVQEAEKQTKFEIVQVGWGGRAGTLLLDAIILFVPMVGAIRTLATFGGWMRSLEIPLVILIFILAFGGHLLSETLLGWTPGRRLRGLQLLDVTGERPPRRRLLARTLLRIAWLVGFVLVMGLVLGAWKGQKEILNYLANAGGGAIPLLAVGCLYLTNLCTPDRRPLHDYLTGISWYQRRPKAELSVQDSVELPNEPGQFASTNANSAAAQMLGRMDQYELRGLLGQGGMGAVYEARDTLLERRVALKVLTSSINVTPTVLRRFEREARLAAQLSHPNIAQVFGVGEAGGQPYIVMEFVDGEDLQKHVQREGPLPLASAWEYIRQTALALREAWRHGIVHRDIKPANLMLDENGAVKVTDFGISRALGDEEGKTESATAGSSNPGDASLTKTGALLGTPMYLSPEQSRGEKLDQRSDIYSLGMTFYFLLSGKPPFEGGDVYDLVMRQCNEEPPPLAGKVADWTPRRNGVLRRMIAKDRAARFQDYDELLQEMEAEAPRPSTLAGFLPRASAQIIDFLLAAGLGLALIGVFFLSAQFSQLDRLNEFWTFLLCVQIATVYVIGIGRWGTTPGKWNLRLRVIRPGGERVGYWRAFVRLLTFNPPLFWTMSWSLWTLAGGASDLPKLFWIQTPINLLAFIGWFTSCCFILFSSRRRGVHDFVAGTMVVQLPERRRWRNWYHRLLSLGR